MAEKKTDVEKQLKTMQKAVKELIDKYAKLDKEFTEHVVTPDAHNPGMMGRNK